MDQTNETPEVSQFADWEAAEVAGTVEEAPKAPESSPEPAQAEPETPEVAEPSDDPSQGPPVEAKQGKPDRDAQIKRLTGERNSERERRAALEARVRELEAKPTQPAAPNAQEAPKEKALRPYPKLSDHDFDEDKHAQDVQAWTDERDAHIAEKREQQESQQRQQQQASEFKQRIDDKITLAKSKYPDFQQVVIDRPGSELPINENMAQVLVHEDGGEDVAYFLGKNPEEAKRIAALSPGRQLVELGKLFSKVNTIPETTASLKPAYKPPTVLSTNEASRSAAGFKDWERMEEQKEARRIQRR